MAAVVHNQIATILSGQSLSAAIQVGGGLIARFAMPAAWDAANLTFQTSTDNVTYQELLDDAGVAITAIASAGVDIIPAAYGGFTYVKIRSGTSSVPVNQSATRKITVVITASIIRVR